MNSLTVIAHIQTGFPSKFGIPRQSGLVKGLVGRIVFTPQFRNAEALRGLEGYSHIWLLWDFSMAHKQATAYSWSPTVRPPRLGGNKRMGVWATRSPFRPNHIGLSSVRILRILPQTPQGPIIEVEGADLMDGTPIYDIKPYLPFTDCHPNARGGFAEEQNRTLQPLEVSWPASLMGEDFPNETDRQVIINLLSADPRPHYQNDPTRVYTMDYAQWAVRFRVEDHMLTVVQCDKKLLKTHV